MLGVAVFGLGVVCLVWLTQVSFATLWRVLGIALVVFGGIQLVGLAQGADLLLVGIVSGQVVFVVVSPLMERRVRRRERYKAEQFRFWASEAAKHHRPNDDEWRRYRMPD